MKTKFITIAVVLAAVLFGCHKKEGEQPHLV